MKIMCSNCGACISLTFSAANIRRVIQKGWRANGHAAYCPECVRTWADRNGDRLQPSGDAMLTLIDEIHRQNTERRHGHDE
jgi:hypothetical protein